jgi:hypothetical protein
MVITEYARAYLRYFKSSLRIATIDFENNTFSIVFGFHFGTFNWNQKLNGLGMDGIAAPAQWRNYVPSGVFPKLNEPPYILKLCARRGVWRLQIRV